MKALLINANLKTVTEVEIEPTREAIQDLIGFKTIDADEIDSNFDQLFFDEECFIRQIRVDMNESDDLIAHYCKIAPEEKKTILSADKDLLQLVNENTTIYSPIAKVFYTHGKKVKIGTYEMPACNILPYKIITGDKSDNINGIYYFGEKTLIKY